MATVVVLLPVRLAAPLLWYVTFSGIGRVEDGSLEMTCVTPQQMPAARFSLPNDRRWQSGGRISVEFRQQGGLFTVKISWGAVIEEYRESNRVATGYLVYW